MKLTVARFCFLEYNMKDGYQEQYITLTCIFKVESRLKWNASNLEISFDTFTRFYSL